MPRPKLEIADIFRASGPAYHSDHAGHPNLPLLKVMSTIKTCRTAALGGHVAACTKCDHQHISYNLCRNPLRGSACLQARERALPQVSGCYGTGLDAGVDERPVAG